MPNTIIVARHAESTFSRDGLVNGDPSIECPLTELGREQARRLGETLRGIDVDVCVTSGFERTKETARIAFAHRGIEVLADPDLNDPRAGRFESRRLGDYLEWHARADWSTGPPGGGESQLDAVRRLTRAWGRIASRSERTVVVVCHALAAAFALTLARGADPALRRRYDIDVGYATPHTLEPSRLAQGLERVRSELGSSDPSPTAASLGRLPSTSHARTTSRPTR